MIVLTSKYCPDANNCYEIKTEIPFYITLILLGSAVLIFKEVFK